VFLGKTHRFDKETKRLFRVIWGGVHETIAYMAKNEKYSPQLPNFFDWVLGGNRHQSLLKN